MKKALVCSVNDYPGDANDLAGANTDNDSWTRFFLDNNFEVTSLKDGQCTRSTIKSKLTKLITEAKKDDVVVFQWSGHGTQLAAMNLDETDGYDEALYVFDGVLRDNDLRTILNKTPEGVHVVLIHDSCFSGSSTRLPKNTKNKTKIKPRFVVTDKISPKATRRKALKDISEDEMVEILVSGCSDSEFSYDAYIGGKSQGAFSYYALKSLKPGQTWDEFYTLLRKSLPSKDYPQTPQLEGSMVNKFRKVFEIGVEPAPQPEPEPQPEPTPEPTPDPTPTPEPEPTLWDWIKQYWFMGPFVLLLIAAFLIKC